MLQIASQRAKQANAHSSLDNLHHNWAMLKNTRLDWTFA